MHDRHMTNTWKIIERAHSHNIYRWIKVMSPWNNTVANILFIFGKQKNISVHLWIANWNHTVPVTTLHRDVRKVFCCSGLKVNTRFQSELLKGSQNDSFIVHTYNHGKHIKVHLNTNLKVDRTGSEKSMFSYWDSHSSHRGWKYSTGTDSQEWRSFG